ncbi:MAG: hypothetical protein RLZZ528_2699 [Pseudomonadota bacterium]
MNDLSAHARVTVVTVAYDSMAVLPQMLASVPGDVAVVIVDNSPAADPALARLAEARGARLIRNDRNLGFGAACNIGAHAAGTEFLFFLNPDALCSPDTIARLVAAMGRYPEASALNPRMADAEGRLQFRRRSSIVPRREWMPRLKYRSDTVVPVLSGAAMLVRAADFRAVGGYDEAIFLYCEDDDLSRRLRAERGQLLAIFDALVIHHEGHSSARTPEMAAFKARHMGESYVYASRKHGKPLAFPRALLSALLHFLSPFDWRDPRRMAKHRGFLEGVLAGNRIPVLQRVPNRWFGPALRLPDTWKVQRELHRFAGQLVAFPREAALYLFSTPYNDLILSRRRKSWAGAIPFGPRVAIVLLFPRDGLQPSHLAMLRYFSDRGFSNVVVSNLPLAEPERQQVLDLSARLIERQNFGYDFGGYRDGVLSLGADFPRVEQLVLINDSSWFPLPGARDWLADVAATGADYVGASTHYSVPRILPRFFRSIEWSYGFASKHVHYGSYALSVGAEILRDPDFMTYWRRFRLTNDKHKVVRRGEAGLTRWVLKRGYTHAETLGIATLDRELLALPDDELRDIARDTILPFDAEMRDEKIAALASGGLSKRELVSLILTAAARQGASYTLAPYSIFHRGFAFLKKGPCRTDRDSAEATLRLAARLPGPEGRMVEAEVRKAVESAFPPGRQG